MSIEQVTNPASIEDAFQEADALLFKERKFDEAQQRYQEILQLEPANIDAMNSIAYCVKFKTQAADGSVDPMVLFQQLHPIYLEVLKIDREDVEANFNMGLLYLQHK